MTAPETFLGDRNERTRAALTLPDDEINKMLAPHVGTRLPVASQEWRSIVSRESSVRKIAARYWRHRVYGWVRSRRARSEGVDRNYDHIWSEIDLAKIVDPKQNLLPHEWRQEGFTLSATISQKLQLSLMIRALQYLRPRSVLEVGSGWGLNLLILACHCPDTRFQGVELTKSGVEMARSLAAGQHLPASLLNFMPQPPLDPTAFQRIAVDRGSAERLPYDDNSFDLVLTRLALEQMESIRETALAEIARVARSHVVMIESFREMNDDGIRRQYAVGNDYFRGRLSDLPRYGLEPIFIYADWPHKITLKPVFVLAVKGRASSEDARSGKS